MTRHIEAQHCVCQIQVTSLCHVVRLETFGMNIFLAVQYNFHLYFEVKRDKVPTTVALRTTYSCSGTHSETHTLKYLKRCKSKSLWCFYQLTIQYQDIYTKILWKLKAILPSHLLQFFVLHSINVVTKDLSFLVVSTSNGCVTDCSQCKFKVEMIF